MNRRGWFVAAAAAYALALVASAPATLLDAKLADASHGRMRLTQAHGTIWAGHADAELRDESGNRQWTGPVGWRLRPAALAGARVEYAVTIAANPPAALGVSWSRVDLAGVDLALPAAALAAGIPALAPLGLTGDVQLSVERLVFLPAYTQGGATMTWRAAGSALAPVAPLGDYELRFEGQGDAVRASLRTLAGPLQVAGHGRWIRGDRPAFVATATLAPEHRAALAPFLRLVAVERSEGTFDWELR